MSTTIQKIQEIEAEMARTQKNKATNAHLGSLKAKIAKLKREIMEPKGGSGGGAGAGFEVTKSGDARVGLIGFPSVGKSTLLSKLTGTHSEVAAYEFTTLTCIPGTFRYKGCKIQLLVLRLLELNLLSLPPPLLPLRLSPLTPLFAMPGFARYY